jgi:hypothetical protein
MNGRTLTLFSKKEKKPGERRIRMHGLNPAVLPGGEEHRAPQPTAP